MSIIFNEAGLKDINPPCVAQTFINHNARLFKLFIIKDKYSVISRPSIKNFQTDDIGETHVLPLAMMNGTQLIAFPIASRLQRHTRLFTLTVTTSRSRIRCRISPPSTMKTISARRTRSSQTRRCSTRYFMSSRVSWASTCSASMLSSRKKRVAMQSSTSIPSQVGRWWWCLRLVVINKQSYSQVMMAWIISSKCIEIL